jgi:cytochrome c-type biogenesis protein CcmE
VSTSGFTVSTPTGERVTVKETSATVYDKGTTTSAPNAVSKGKTVLVIGKVNGTTITAAQVIVGPAINLSKASAKVIAFKQGSQSASKTVGRVPANYKEGSGTIVSGTAATKASKAALTSYAGGIVDRVVRLSNGEYEVHYIGVNWPHHIFVTSTFKVVGAN